MPDTVCGKVSDKLKLSSGIEGAERREDESGQSTEEPERSAGRGKPPGTGKPSQGLGRGRSGARKGRGGS